MDVQKMSRKVGTFGTELIRGSDIYGLLNIYDGDK
jgi:hypothetical protein